MDDRDADGIRRILHAYGDAVSTRDEAAWAALWTDDARWTLDAGRVLEGRDAIVEHWRTAIAAYRELVQVYLSNTATVDGDEAVGRAYLTELAVATDGDRRVMVGWYDDKYRRTPAGWRYASRSLTKLYRGAPDLGGQFFGQPSGS